MRDDLYQHKLDNLHFYIADLTNYHNAENEDESQNKKLIWF